MFEKIIFPTDFSKPARTELNCITSIPGIREIIILHVIKQYAIPMGVDTVENLELQTTKVYLQEAKTYVASLNPAIRVTLEETIATDITGSIWKSRRTSCRPDRYPRPHKGHHCWCTPQLCIFKGALPCQ